jgi:cathepsin C
MIYDEGFEVVLGDQVFFAFSKFDFINDPNKGKTNISHCGATEVGWYHDKRRSQWGCYVGKQVSGSGSASSGSASSVPQDPPKRKRPSLDLNLDSWSDQQTLGLDDDDDKSKDDTVTTTMASTDNLSQEYTVQASTESPSQESNTQDLHIAGMSDASLMALHKWMSTPSILDAPDSDAYKPQAQPQSDFNQPLSQEWHENVVQGLNLLQLGWHAEAYSRYNGMTGKQMLKSAGLQRKIQKNPRATIAPTFLGLSSSHMTKSAAQAHVAEPEALDWRNKDGQNFCDKVITQGDCGSCYGISTVRMLSARNRVRSGNPNEPEFSINFPLYCSEYNQGCDGGYGFLQTKWSEDVGLVPETCAPYTQSGTCSMQGGCSLGSKRHRATNHHYVGGYYGGSEHVQMKQELVAGGPMVMSFEPKEDFMYYKGGVYKSGPNQIHQEWEQVDHAVLLIGYGNENGNKYWQLQNSWGTDWGEDGYFRMARGIDESGCESIAVAADVIEEDSNPTLDDFVSMMQSA